MKLFILFLFAFCLAISGCTTLEDGGGKIGTEYAEDPAFRTSKAQDAQSQIRRAIY